MKKRVISLFFALLLCLPLGIANATVVFDDAQLGSQPEKQTKTSADFSDLKDLDAATKAKFDAMISAGIFDGVAEGKFGLKDEMNRAQFAKVAALIFGLEVDTSLKSSSFKDVKSDDAANGYALPYIEAVKAAGITDGYGEGTYNPAGKVTKEQLAGFLVKALGMKKEAEASAGVNDSTVSEWAKGYVALALDKKLLSNGADGKFGGSTNATRDLLVTGAFEAKEQFVEIKKQEEEKKKEEEEKKKEEETPPVTYYPPVVQTVATPTASPAGGTVAAGTQVTLSSATVSSAVYYTTDGSTPTTSSSHFIETGIVTISSDTTIKAFAVKSGMANSAVATFEYTVTTVASPIVLPLSISAMTEGQLYASSVAKLSGGTGAVTYAVTNGALPTGLTLNPSTGAIAGTPSVSGSYDFTITATDSATTPATAEQEYTGSIAAASGDHTAPIFNASGLPQSPGSKQVSIEVRSNEAGTAYVVVVAHSAQAPSAANIMAGKDASGGTPLSENQGNTTLEVYGNGASILVGPLPADSTLYDAYVVVQDAAGNVSEPVEADIWTPAAVSQDFEVIGLSYDEDDGTFIVSFSLDVDSSSIATGNYLLTNSGDPIAVTVTNAALYSPTDVKLTLSLNTWYSDVPDGETISITVSGVTGAGGVTLTDGTHDMMKFTI